MNSKMCRSTSFSPLWSLEEKCLPTDFSWSESSMYRCSADVHSLFWILRLVWLTYCLPHILHDMQYTRLELLHIFFNICHGVETLACGVASYCAGFVANYAVFTHSFVAKSTELCGGCLSLWAELGLVVGWQCVAPCHW